MLDAMGYFIKYSGNFRGKSRLIWHWMSKRNVTEKRTRVLPGGGRVQCDLSVPYEAMVWLGVEEQHDLEVLRGLLKPGQSFVDCGANIGIWSLVAASAVGLKGQVYAFEPNPDTVQKLKRNILLQELENIHVTQAAVGKECGSVNFICEDSHNISHIAPAKSIESIQVPTVNLDTILNGKSISGCKIDVEGYELDVLKGAENLLKSHYPWLCIEFNTILSKVDNLKDWDVHQYLNELGYSARRFENCLDQSSKSILAYNWQTSGYCNLFYSFKP